MDSLKFLDRNSSAIVIVSVCFCFSSAAPRASCGRCRLGWFLVVGSGLLTALPEDKAQFDICGRSGTGCQVDEAVVMGNGGAGGRMERVRWIVPAWSYKATGK